MVFYSKNISLSVIRCVSFSFHTVLKKIWSPIKHKSRALSQYLLVLTSTFSLFYLRRIKSTSGLYLTCQKSTMNITYLNQMANKENFSFNDVTFSFTWKEFDDNIPFVPIDMVTFISWCIHITPCGPDLDALCRCSR